MATIPNKAAGAGIVIGVDATMFKPNTVMVGESARSAWTSSDSEFDLSIEIGETAVSATSSGEGVGIQGPRVGAHGPDGAMYLSGPKRHVWPRVPRERRAIRVGHHRCRSAFWLRPAISISTATISRPTTAMVGKCTGPARASSISAAARSTCTSSTARPRCRPPPWSARRLHRELRAPCCRTRPQRRRSTPMYQTGPKRCVCRRVRRKRQAPFLVSANRQNLKRSGLLTQTQNRSR
jgi:hypothetical protein